MNPNYLDFEQPIVELEDKIRELRNVTDNKLDLEDEVKQLEKKTKQLIKQTFSNLTDWQVSQLARHPQRPYTLDYINMIFDEFVEMHGDRAFADDAAIVGGVGRIEDVSVVVIGHQKGRSIPEKVKRNFGMPRPEGYRKAARLMRVAERFNMPIVTFIDTPGAYPGIDAEERGQSIAIAENLQLMADLKTPIVSLVIGEGGSGGALAIGVADKLMMLEYSTYSVISPEGCASILWKTAAKAPDAAAAMGVSAQKLLSLGLIDEIVSEPLGGAHRDPKQMAEQIKRAVTAQIKQLQKLPHDDLISQRFKRLMSYGSEKNETLSLDA
ncbi:MAG: acetyl-CoA carboxylase carboxyltransferase subunit alpha [Pseudomonadota bacterium]|nr:acetyl-CoA carboxylase carboxyl transferase subunit alpha [Gammaproteobacteria bacterium]MEC8012064.1 acetyl-CoA carboxylase carboxyltransferase subunit alpha [Pseudomonadota bacterium]|tara:strand:- start:12166 stop:13140 length:975 start_codon:yes stop_codon:yes gene_type:complete